MTTKFKAAYEEILCMLKANGYEDDFLEPFEHVAEVEDLRKQFAPTYPKLLLIAESHVRVRDLNAKAGFVYDARYYTPWWHSLFIPGFGAGRIRTNPELRRTFLLRMQQAGFWILDVSLLALSGYKKLGFEKSRPFDRKTTDEIKRISWERYVFHQYSGICKAPSRPLVVAFESVVETLSSCITPECLLKFENAKNSRDYRRSNFEGGTSSFREIATRAGLDELLAEFNS